MESDDARTAAATLLNLTRHHPELAVATLGLALTHETKNALNSLVLQIALLRRRLDSDPAAQSIVDAMSAAVARADAVLEAASRLARTIGPDVRDEHFESVARALKPPGP